MAVVHAGATQGHYDIHGEERIVPVPTLGALIMSRCINRASQHGQRIRNKILTDHFIYFLSIGVVVAPKGR